MPNILTTQKALGLAPVLTNDKASDRSGVTDPIKVVAHLILYQAHQLQKHGITKTPEEFILKVFLVVLWVLTRQVCSDGCVGKGGFQQSILTVTPICQHFRIQSYLSSITVGVFNGNENDALLYFTPMMNELFKLVSINHCFSIDWIRRP